MSAMNDEPSRIVKSNPIVYGPIFYQEIADLLPLTGDFSGNLTTLSVMKHDPEPNQAPPSPEIENADSKLDAEMIARAAHSIAVALSVLLACARRTEQANTRIDLPSVGAALGPDTLLP